MCCTPKWSVLYNVLWELYFHFLGPESIPYQVTVLSCLIALLKIEIKLSYGTCRPCTKKHTSGKMSKIFLDGSMYPCNLKLQLKANIGSG